MGQTIAESVKNMLAKVGGGKEPARRQHSPERS